MTRLHVHVGVEDLSQSIRFYSALFGQAPAVEKTDYAKWMLDDPQVNFAISTQAAQTGVDHLGFQVETDAELKDVAQRLTQAGLATRDEPGARCCYARSDKAWTADPQDVAWEIFHTTGQIQVYREPADPCCGSTESQTKSDCCGTAAA